MSLSRLLHGALLPLRLSLLLLLPAGPGLAQTVPHSVPDTMFQRVMACTPCHGAQGRASSAGYLPRIAGKPAGYLYTQLQHFRDGRRSNAAMAHLLAPLTDDYLREIANHYARLDLPYPPPQPATAPAAVLARGEALVRRGDPARRLPACAACHGEALTGVLPGVPGLLGLPRDYLVGQMGNWMQGRRRATAPDCMAEIARALGPDDVAAVASWLAAQPVTGNSRPAAAVPLPLPRDCGSHPG